MEQLTVSSLIVGECCKCSYIQNETLYLENTVKIDLARRLELIHPISISFAYLFSRLTPTYQHIFLPCKKFELKQIQLHYLLTDVQLTFERRHISTKLLIVCRRLVQGIPCKLVLRTFITK